jgi:hypothetical protein
MVLQNSRGYGRLAQNLFVGLPQHLMVLVYGGSGVQIFHLVLYLAIFAEGSLGRIFWLWKLQLPHFPCSLFRSARILKCAHLVLGCRYL